MTYVSNRVYHYPALTDEEIEQLQRRVDQMRAYQDPEMGIWSYGFYDLGFIDRLLWDLEEAKREVARLKADLAHHAGNRG